MPTNVKQPRISGAVLLRLTVVAICIVSICLKAKELYEVVGFLEYIAIIAGKLCHGVMLAW